MEPINPHPEREESRTEATVLRSMLLLSTLRAAAEVRFSLSERKAGRDPSAQEEAHVAIPELRESRRELQQLAMRLRASLVYAQHHGDDPASQLVRRFDDLMALARAGRLLHTIHQRLLSLYPAVGEALVEEARHLEGRCQALSAAEDEAFLEELGPFLEQALTFAAHLKQQVA